MFLCIKMFLSNLKSNFMSLSNSKHALYYIIILDHFQINLGKYDYRFFQNNVDFQCALLFNTPTYFQAKQDPAIQSWIRRHKVNQWYDIFYFFQNEWYDHFSQGIPHKSQLLLGHDRMKRRQRKPTICTTTFIFQGIEQQQ